VASLAKAAKCIGLSGTVSVVRDFFGHRTPTPAPLSVRTQLLLLQGSHVHLNFIRTAALNDMLLRRVDAALQGARALYAAAGIGIGRIRRFAPIHGGFEIIMGDDVALDLFDSWSAPGDAVDVFLALSIAGPSGGKSPIDGSCDKDGKDSGMVVAVVDAGGPVLLATAITHELGHYLGLVHDTNPANLMFASAPNGGQLGPSQAATMKDHCFMRGGCAT
jgi:hypothetical protein